MNRNVDRNRNETKYQTQHRSNWQSASIPSKFKVSGVCSGEFRESRSLRRVSDCRDLRLCC